MPGYKCLYLFCSNRDNGGKSLFRCPHSRQKAVVWLEAAGREDIIEKNYKNYKLCEDHFEPKYIFMTTRGKRLYNDAIPSIFRGPKRHVTDVVSEEPPQKIVILAGLSTSSNSKVPSVVFSVSQSTKNVPGKPTTTKETSTTADSVASTSSIDSNIGQKNFGVVANEEVESNPIAEELLSIKEESELYCRLCLCVSSDFNSYINIFPSNGENSLRQDKIQEMIHKVLPDLNLSLTYNPGICIDCENRLHNAYDLISFSIENQNTLIDYKNKHGDDPCVNIQDVMKEVTSNKRPMTEVYDLPSKKKKTSISNNDHNETKWDEYSIEDHDNIKKEELDCEYSYDSFEGISNQTITEESSNRLLNLSRNKENYNLSHTEVSFTNFTQTTSNISETSSQEENLSDEVEKHTKKLVDLKSTNSNEVIPGNTIETISRTRKKVIQSNKSK